MKRIACLIGLACACLIGTPKKSSAEIFPAAVGDSLRLDFNCLDSLGKPIVCDSAWMTVYRFPTSGSRVLVDSGRATTFTETAIGSGGKLTLLPGRDTVYMLSTVGNTTVGLYKLNVKAYGGTMGASTKLTVEFSRWYVVGAATTTDYLAAADDKKLLGTAYSTPTTAGIPEVELANTTTQGGTSMVLTGERQIFASATAGEPAVKYTGNTTGAGMRLIGGNTAPGPGLQVNGGTAAGSVGFLVGGSVSGGAAESLVVASGTRTEAHVGAASAEGTIFAKIGMNLSDVNGTLDASELGGDAATEIADSTINSMSYSANDNLLCNGSFELGVTSDSVNDVPICWTKVQGVSYLSRYWRRDGKWTLVLKGNGTTEPIVRSDSIFLFQNSWVTLSGWARDTALGTGEVEFCDNTGTQINNFEVQNASYWEQHSTHIKIPATGNYFVRLRQNSTNANMFMAVDDIRLQVSDYYDTTGMDIANRIVDTLGFALDKGNLLRNGDFESRGISLPPGCGLTSNQGWYNLAGTTCIRTNTSTLKALFGRNYLRAIGASAKAASDSVYLKVGDRVLLQASMRGSKIAGTPGVILENGAGTAKLTLAQQTADRWETQYGTYRISAGDGAGYYRVAILAGSNASDSIWADQISLRGILDTIPTSAAAISAADMGSIAESTWAKKQDRYDGGSFGNSFGRFLDTTISSRSTLITTDNIGINWADITNPTTVQGLSGTTIKAVTDPVTTTAADKQGIRDTSLNLGNPDPGNMVSNPSFERTEAGSLVGWRTNTGNAARNTLAAKAGKFGMILRGDGVDAGDIRSDTIRLLAGQRVIIGGKVRNGGAAGLGKIFLVRKGGTIAFTLSSTPGIGWRELYGEFQANLADTVYYVGLSSNSNSATDSSLFDEIYVRGVGFQRFANEVNLLRDPGFENKILGDAWTVTAGTGTITSQGFIPVGVNRLRLGGSSSRVISDTFSIQPGHAVFFGGMCLTSDAASQNTIDLQTLAGASQAAANPTVSLNNKWVNVWNYFRNTSGVQTNYRLSLQGGPAVGDTASFDHLFIFPTDTLNAIGSGGGGGAGCAGSGAFVCSVFVNDTGTTTGISGTNVSIWNGTTLVAGPLFTTATGKLAFQLDNGTYSIRAFNVGYRYTTNVDTVLTVSGANTKDTVYLKATTLGPATTPGLVRVQGDVRDLGLDSNIVGVEVIVEAVKNNLRCCETDTVNFFIAGKYTKTAIWATSGRWYIDIPASASWNPDTDYRFRIHVPGVSEFTKVVTVPNTNPWRLQWAW